MMTATNAHMPHHYVVGRWVDFLHIMAAEDVRPLCGARSAQLGWSRAPRAGVVTLCRRCLQTAAQRGIVVEE